MHSFCKTCLIDFSTSVGQVSCPQCSKSITVDLSTRSDVEDQPKKTTIRGFKASSILNRIRLEEFQTSTKIEALVCGLCLPYFYFGGNRLYLVLELHYAYLQDMRPYECSASFMVKEKGKK